jgi:type IV pilus assembly protein PilA
MLARIRKSQEDEGFTLIELLVVMIIIGILAAIAIPVFLNQRKKAQDSAAKADVSTIGKEIATYFVDNCQAPTVSNTLTAGRYDISAAVSATATCTNAAYPASDIGKQSTNVALNLGAANAATDSTHWCVGVVNAQGDVKNFKYSAQNGLEKGSCTDASAP